MLKNINIEFPLASLSLLIASVALGAFILGDYAGVKRVCHYAEEYRGDFYLSPCEEPNDEK